MNYEAVWRVLDDLITELRKAGEEVPPSVMKDLRSAKTTIHILKADRDNHSHLMRIEEFLANVESYAMHRAQEKFGTHVVNCWVDRLENAKREVHEEVRPAGKFIPGVPRDKYWIRIKTTKDITLNGVKRAAEEEGLEQKIHKSGYVIVYGEKSKIQNFVRRMSGLQQSVGQYA